MNFSNFAVPRILQRRGCARANTYCKVGMIFRLQILSDPDLLSTKGAPSFMMTRYYPHAIDG